MKGSHQGKMFILKLEVRPIWEKCLLPFGVRGKSKNKKNKHSQKSNQKNWVKNHHKSYLPQEKQHILLDPESSEDEEEDTVGNQAVSEDLQRAVLNCNEYMCVSKGQKHGAVLETSSQVALKLHRSTVGKTVKRGKVQRGIREQNCKMHRRFEKMDEFWKDLIRQSIYEFYYTKIAPTLDMLLQKLKER